MKRKPLLNTRKKCRQNKIVNFNHLKFFKQCFIYIFVYIKKGDIYYLKKLIYYIIVYIETFIINNVIKPTFIINNKQKTLILLNNKQGKITNLFFYFYYLIKYYSAPQHYNQLYNFNYLNYLFTNIFLFLYKYNFMDLVLDEN